MSIIGVGHAIVDLFVEADAEFIASLGRLPGSMALVEPDATRQVLEKLNVVKANSGGSAANTMVGVASLGHPACFVGTLGDDEFGAMYLSDLTQAQVEFRTDKTVVGQRSGETGHCVVVVTPDGQRTMLTHLGASSQVAQALDGLEECPRDSIIYLEGYVLDSPNAATAITNVRARARARARGPDSVRLAFSLSDANLVERRRQEIRELLERGSVSILLGNESEVCALVGTSDLDEACDEISALVDQGAVTLGEKGAIVFRGDKREAVPAMPTKVIDTTGAGDLFAAGYLVGVTKGLSLYGCGALGVMCATEAVSHFGARPAVSLAEMAIGYGL